MILNKPSSGDSLLPQGRIEGAPDGVPRSRPATPPTPRIPLATGTSSGSQLLLAHAFESKGQPDEPDTAWPDTAPSSGVVIHQKSRQGSPVAVEPVPAFNGKAADGAPSQQQREAMVRTGRDRPIDIFDASLEGYKARWERKLESGAPGVKADDAFARVGEAIEALNRHQLRRICIQKGAGLFPMDEKELFQARVERVASVKGELVVELQDTKGQQRRWMSGERWAEPKRPPEPARRAPMLPKPWLSRRRTGPRPPAGPFMRERSPQPRRDYDGARWLETLALFASSREGKQAGDLDAQRECVRCGYGWFPTRSGAERHANIESVEIQKSALVYRVRGADRVVWLWSAGAVLPDEQTPVVRGRALGSIGTASATASPNDTLRKTLADIVPSGSAPNLPQPEMLLEVVEIGSRSDFEERIWPEQHRLQDRLGALAALPQDTVSEMAIRDTKAQLSRIENTLLRTDEQEVPALCNTPLRTEAAPPAPRRCCPCTLL